ncbi:hypothetical protein BDZ88DRAFT_56547 [Geranomyces variabilis]|nr:hypothetical protein BDZ88DRAFT_56547 [Geranomyces variabilis]
MLLLVLARQQPRYHAGAAPGRRRRDSNRSTIKVLLERASNVEIETRTKIRPTARSVCGAEGTTAAEVPPRREVLLERASNVEIETRTKVRPTARSMCGVEGKTAAEVPPRRAHLRISKVRQQAGYHPGAARSVYSGRGTTKACMLAEFESETATRVPPRCCSKRRQRPRYHHGCTLAAFESETATRVPPRCSSTTRASYRGTTTAARLRLSKVRQQPGYHPGAPRRRVPATEVPPRYRVSRQSTTLLLLW